jgi:hypothetical protein
LPAAVKPQAAQIASRELLVIRPQPLADLRDRRARQQQPARLILESVLDIAHGKAAGQQLDRQILERLRAALEVLADLRSERLVAAGDLRRRVLDHALRRLQPPGA